MALPPLEGKISHACTMAESNQLFNFWCLNSYLINELITYYVKNLNKNNKVK